MNLTVGAQTDCGLQYDGNGDGAVDLMDLLGLLSEYSDTCEPAFACGQPVLFDDHSYETVQIGEQCWFADNLRTVHYTNGDEIPGGLSNSEWSNTLSGAQAVFGDMDVHLETYGRLYNGYAVDDSRGLCPSGWHVPTDGEWATLEMELGMSEFYADSIGWRGTDQGTQMKSSFSDMPSWDGTNSSGFSGLPGGNRISNGVFFNESNSGYWWCAFSDGTLSTGYRRLSSNYDGSYRDNNLHPRFGCSVRCIRDE